MSEVPVSNNSNLNLDSNNSDLNLDSSDCSNLNVIDNVTDAHRSELVKKSISLYLMKLQSINFLPVSTIDEILGELSILHNKSESIKQDKINNILEDYDVEEHLKSKICTQRT